MAAYSQVGGLGAWNATSISSTSSLGSFSTTWPTERIALRLSLSSKGAILADDGNGGVVIPVQLFNDLKTLISMAELAQLVPQEEK